jgi:hypothetical protein
MDFSALTVRDIKWGREWQALIYIMQKNRILKVFTN